MNHGIATATNDESPSTIAIECSQSKALAVPDTLEEDDIIIVMKIHILTISSYSL
jgi:hypothetical protein